MNTHYTVGIVGAGFAGLVAALRLKKSGHESFIVFEEAAEVGGTWRDNVYPGCACDVASPLYSFADEPNANWSHLFSEQPEILEYMKSVVDKNNIRSHIRFQSNITKAIFDSGEGVWRVTDEQNQVFTVKILLGALGPLNRVSKPNIPGFNLFKGKAFHSAEWNRDCDLTSKNVAVVGTGASAIQIIPKISAVVRNLIVFQRTPAWITDRFDREFSADAKKRFAKFPSLMKWQREFQFWVNEFFGLGFIGNKTIHKLMTWAALRKLKKEVNDPETIKKLTPNYKIGCKRILKSDDFYPTFNRKNVVLETNNILCFTENGIKTNDGKEHLLDVVIYATGFHVADFNFPINIQGLGGLDLFNFLKKSGGQTFKGMTVAGFPNIAFILGPNTGLGHNSVVHMMESQMNYMMGYIEQIESLNKTAFLDVKEGVVETYNKVIQKQFLGTVWDSGCKSWYLDSNGINTTLYPRLNTNFRKITKRFDVQDYIILNN